MRVDTIATLVRHDLGRTRGALATSGFGIMAGTAALAFFLALGLGVRGVLLGDVFPIDQIELEPRRSEDPGLLAALAGRAKPPVVAVASVDALGKHPDAAGVFPKLRFAFPASARGGKEVLGRDFGAAELVGDGIDPRLLQGELEDLARQAGREPIVFRDPLKNAGAACASDADCSSEQYCERPTGAEKGSCSEPVPALVSRYLVEVFDKSIAPAHGLPPVGGTLASRAEGITFEIRLGESVLGRARMGEPRTARARLVGVSRRAVDLGVTLPIDVVERWNREYGGDAAGYSSVVVAARSPDGVSHLIAEGAKLGLEPKETRARDVSVLISGTVALLSLVALAILLVSASTIAYTFRVLVAERQREIALYRAVGATASEMRAWVIALALSVGVLAGAAGLVIARAAALVTDIAAGRKLPDFPFKPESFFLFPAWLWGAGLAFAAGFALLGALGPARRAAKIDPAAALQQP